MISLGPIKDAQKVKELFDKEKIAYNENCGCVIAKNGDNQLGFCLYELTGNEITVLYLEPECDVPLADGILRSTLHVAVEEGIQNAFYGEKMSEQLLSKIKFIKNLQEKRLDINKLFESCCGCL